MKRGKKPTRKQKETIKAANLNPKNWLVYKNINGELHVVHRDTGTKRKIYM